MIGFFECISSWHDVFVHRAQREQNRRAMRRSLGEAQAVWERLNDTLEAKEFMKI